MISPSDTLYDNSLGIALVPHLQLLLPRAVRYMHIFLDTIVIV